MGNVFTAIENEEKELRLSERRTELYQEIDDIWDIKSEEGREELKQITEKFEKTFEPDSDDDETTGISDKDVVFTKLPWEDLEREEDKNNCEKECKTISKKEDLLMKLAPHLQYKFDFVMENKQRL